MGFIVNDPSGKQSLSRLLESRRRDDDDLPSAKIGRLRGGKTGSLSLIINPSCYLTMVFDAASQDKQGDLEFKTASGDRMDMFWKQLFNHTAARFNHLSIR